MVCIGAAMQEESARFERIEVENQASIFEQSVGFSLDSPAGLQPGQGPRTNGGHVYAK